MVPPSNMLLRLVLLSASLTMCSSRNDTSYGACTSSSLCAEVTPRCVGFNNRLDGRQIGLCTIACTTSNDCPDRGVCINTETPSLGFVCVQRCTDPSECRFSAAICPNVRPGENGCVP